MGESIGPSVVNTSKEKSKTPWVDLFKPKCDRKDMLRLEFFAPVNGGAVIEDNELIVFKEPWPFALLGCFAGRFPGITAIQSLVDSWKVPCKWDTASEPLGLQKVSEEPRSSEPSQEHPPTSEEEQESPKDPVQSEPASPISSGTNGNSVASPLGSNTARGKNVLNNVIAEVFHDNAGAKAKKKTNPKNNVAPKNLSGTLGYKEALMSPPSDKEITNIVDKRLAKKLTPLPVKDKTAARGGGRRKPTSVLK
nr:uncharacterized protein LOC111395991 [Ipomoea batatas]GME01404.1 uncharacterized protein LOC111395991 [Ipomoea batatas]GME21276.1 uncharacterized protein LOC111395991 [Ipomoea batatas]